MIRSKVLLVLITGLLAVELLLVACSPPATPAATCVHMRTIDKGKHSGIKTREQLVMDPNLGGRNFGASMSKHTPFHQGFLRWISLKIWS